MEAYNVFTDNDTIDIDKIDLTKSCYLCDINMVTETYIPGRGRYYQANIFMSDGSTEEDVLNKFRHLFIKSQYLNGTILDVIDGEIKRRNKNGSL